MGNYRYEKIAIGNTSYAIITPADPGPFEDLLTPVIVSGEAGTKIYVNRITAHVVGLNGSFDLKIEYSDTGLFAGEELRLTRDETAAQVNDTVTVFNVPGSGLVITEGAALKIVEGDGTDGNSYNIVVYGAKEDV